MPARNPLKAHVYMTSFVIIRCYAIMFCKATNVILIVNACILSSLSGVFSKDIIAHMATERRADAA